MKVINQTHMQPRESDPLGSVSQPHGKPPSNAQPSCECSGPVVRPPDGYAGGGLLLERGHKPEHDPALANWAIGQLRSGSPS
jgi:hypothetical protein